MTYQCVAVAALLASQALAAEEWQTLYDRGFKLPGVRAWTSKLTQSKLTPDGLHIADTSKQKGSGRFYYLPWHAAQEAGAAVEARLRSVSCSTPWGMTLLVADGVHEEGITFYPDRVVFAWSKLSAQYDCADGFHTYLVRVKGADIMLYADGQLLVDGRGKFTAPATNARNQVGFGAGSSDATGEAVWEFVRFLGPKLEVPLVETPNVPGLQVEVGQTQVILPNKHYVSMFKFADRDIVVGGRRSSDGGETWRNSTSFHVGAYQFPDGEIVQLGFKTARTERDGVFRVPLWRSKDNGKTTQSKQVTMNVPEATGGTGDDGKPFEGPLCDHSIVGLRDGSLLAAMYGYFKTDTVLCEAFPKGWKLYKYRTFVMRSADRGKTWDYLATVAYDPKVGIESFCEADLLVLPSGEVLCFMRTGGSGGKFTPLHLSRSADDGKTWSKPEPIADRGVWPNTCLMDNGVIACTYGRPGNWLAFSLDHGRTWTGHFCFYAGATTSYNSVEEVAPDKLLVVYDRRGVNDDGESSHEVVGTYVTVKRK